MIPLYRPIRPGLFTPEQDAALRVATARPGVYVEDSQAFTEALGRQERYIQLGRGEFYLYGDVIAANDDVLIQGIGFETVIRFAQDAEFLFSGDRQLIRDLCIDGADTAFAKTYSTKVTGEFFTADNVWFKDSKGGLSLQGDFASVHACMVTGHTTCGILASGDRARIHRNYLEAHAGGFGDIRIVGANSLVNHNQIPGGAPGVVDAGGTSDWTHNML